MGNENKNNMSWGNAIMGLGVAGAGIIGGDKRNQRAFEQQKDLMALQNQYQQGLNQQGSNLQYDMWLKTNYPAQVEQMKKAGLNVGMMYGGSGPGGSTGSQGGGSASGGNAPAPNPMDLQNMLLASQIKKTDAETKATENSINVQNATIQELIATTSNKTLEYNLLQIDQWDKEIEYEYNKEVFNKRISMIGETLDELRLKNDLTRDMYDDLITEQFGKGLKALNDAELTKQQAKLTTKELGVFDEVFKMKVKELEIAEGKLNVDVQNAWTNELLAEIKNRLGEKEIDVKKWNIIARSADNLINNLFGVFNNRNDEEKGYGYNYDDGN